MKFATTEHIRQIPIAYSTENTARPITAFFLFLGVFALVSITFAAEDAAPYAGPWHGWHGWHGHVFGFWWIFPLMMIVMFVFFLHVFRRGRRHWQRRMCENPGHGPRHEGSQSARPESALDILKKRYALGEIDKAEYEDKKTTIEHGDQKS